MQGRTGRFAALVPSSRARVSGHSGIVALFDVANRPTVAGTVARAGRHSDSETVKHAKFQRSAIRSPVGSRWPASRRCLAAAGKLRCGSGSSFFRGGSDGLVGQCAMGGPSVALMWWGLLHEGIAGHGSTSCIVAMIHSLSCNTHMTRVEAAAASHAVGPARPALEAPPDILGSGAHDASSGDVSSHGIIDSVGVDQWAQHWYDGAHDASGQWCTGCI